MTFDDIIQITRNRLTALEMARTAAFTNGDLAQVNAIDLEIISTQAALNQLLSVKGS